MQEFKEGDTVRVVGVTAGHFFKEFKIGDHGLIVYEFNDGSFNVKFNKYQTHNVHTRFLEHIAHEPSKEFLESLEHKPLEEEKEVDVDSYFVSFDEDKDLGKEISPNLNRVAEVLKKDPSDIQIGGDHYKDMPIQPFIFCQKNKIPFGESSVIKYVCRHKNKNGLQDLLKARHFINMVIEEEYGAEHAR